MSREPREIVREAVEAFARQDNEATVRDYADDIVWDLTGYDGWPDRTTYRGLEEIQRFFREWISPWEEWRWETIELIEAGDDVVVTGRDRGRLEGSTAEVERSIVQVWSVREGQIVRIANFRTLAEALESAGMQPSGGEAQASSAAIVQRALETWNSGDQEGAAALFHEDAEVRSVLARSFQGDDLYRGPEGVRAWMTSIADNIELRVDPERLFAYGDYVLLLGTARGRALSGGPDVLNQYGAVCRVDNGRIVLFESHFDHGDALIALGQRLKGERPTRQEAGADEGDLRVG